MTTKTATKTATKTHKLSSKLVKALAAYEKEQRVSRSKASKAYKADTENYSKKEKEFLRSIDRGERMTKEQVEACKYAIVKALYVNKSMSISKLSKAIHNAAHCFINLYRILDSMRKDGVVTSNGERAKKVWCLVK
jgi:hypothetical protein